MLVDAWNKFMQFAKDWGTNSLVVGLFMFILGLLVYSLFPKIWRLFVRFVTWIWAKIRGQEAYRDFEKTYLDWLIRKHRYVGLIPAQIVARKWGERQQFVDLEDIFVRLSISTRTGDEHWAQTYGEGGKSWRKRPLRIKKTNPTNPINLEAGLTKLISNSLQQIYQPGDLGLVIDRHSKLILRGDPGSGKTTMLRYLAVTCARALRKNKAADGDSPHLVKRRLLWDTRPFPIFVTLRRHGKVAIWSETREFTDIFLEEMPPELRNRCPKGFFEWQLHKGNCLILLDAFDELGSPDARAAMAQRISGFLEIYGKTANRIVVTTRIVGYEGQLDQQGFVVRTVQNLNAGEIRALVKQRYKAISASETTGRQIQAASDLAQNLIERSKQLIEKIESTPRLAQLATNPMLLSLIVLVHFLKVKLPEERLLLYRDCVEILTERWQQVKLEETGIRSEEREKLTLSQKLALLREIAFKMQQQREMESSPALMPREIVRDLIGEKLPDFLSGELLQSEIGRQEVSRSKAEEWIKGIETESGILVEQGLDESGEPLIGFSHLTFQEYLAAVALNDIPTFQPLLWQNLLKPAWREVVLLYVALTNNAAPVITALLESPTQPKGLLLAAYCLAERVKGVKADVQQLTLTKLKEGFLKVDNESIGEFGKVMAALGGSEVIAFLRTQINNPILSKRLAALRSLGQVGVDDSEIEKVRADLVQLVETSKEAEITVVVREALAKIGDPRFIGAEPVLIPIPKQLQGVSASPIGWKELYISLIGTIAKNFKQRLALVLKVLDRLLYLRWFAFWQHQPQYNEFQIGKYPVTNIEYSRFVEATGHKPPKHWVEGTFPPEQATHPVKGIEYGEEDSYCEWLCSQTGKKYRIPTEWEWEWAATGIHGWSYPWGDQFDKSNCNSIESGIEGTTPVGSYLEGISSFGVSDMSGNVWERTKGCMIFSRLFSYEFIILYIILLITIFLLHINLYFKNIILDIIFGFLILILIVWLVILFLGTLVYRGGSWNSSINKCTCFYRANEFNALEISETGFRCLKEP